MLNPIIRKPVHKPVSVAESQLHFSPGVLDRKAVKPAINIAMPDMPYWIQYVTYMLIMSLKLDAFNATVIFIWHSETGGHACSKSCDTTRVLVRSSSFHSRCYPEIKRLRFNRKSLTIILKPRDKAMKALKIV